MLEQDVWARLTQLARTTPKAVVAVPFFGTGGFDLLPLRKGSRLVVRFDLPTVRAGLVNPREVVRLLANDVEVRRCANLHAKVFVFGNRAIVGSTNVSYTSANNVIEAAVEVPSSTFANRCRKFVNALNGDVVSKTFAESMIPHYRPPKNDVKKKSKSGNAVPAHSPLWWVNLSEKGWDEVDSDQADAGWSKAERALVDPKNFEIDTFTWPGKGLVERLRQKSDTRVLMNTTTADGAVLVSPPGRVIDIRPYRKKGKPWAIVYVELPKGRRRRGKSAFLKALGPEARQLGKAPRTRLLRHAGLVNRIGRVFG